MSRKTRIRFGEYVFFIDCKYSDEIIQEDSFAFGAIVELYIENCYFKHHNVNFSQIKNVIDLGANRGLFSCLAANFCEKVVCVEPQKPFHNALIRNMAINCRTNYVIEGSFVGGEGKLRGFENNITTIEEIMQKNNLAAVDFLKIDIEGSEFGLFEKISCLEKIRYLTMEVHHDYGDVSKIINKLKEYGFRLILCDNYCDITSKIEAINYIYASNTKQR